MPTITDLIKKIPRKTKIMIIILTLTTSTITFLMMGLIPMFQGKEIIRPTRYTYKHYSENGYYRIKVERNTDYTLILHFASYKGDIELQLFSNSLKIIGKNERLHIMSESSKMIKFHARHNGHYYLTLKNSKGVYLSLYLSTSTYSYSYELDNSYINTWKFFLVTIASLLMLFGIVMLASEYKGKLNQTKITENMKTCPSCGMVYKSETEYCTACGYTFTPPKDYKNY